MDSLTINLNAHKIEYLGSTGYLFNVFRDGQDNYDDGDKTILTINGDGEISTTGECIATAGEGGGIVINGGTHTTSGSTLYKSTGGKIEITKGSFESTLTADSYTLFNGSNTDITVRGGSFYKWDPSGGDAVSKSDSDPAKNEKNFLSAEGNLDISRYVVIYDTPTLDWNYVTKEYIVKDEDNNDSDIKDALEDPDVTIIDVYKDLPLGEQLWVEKPGDLTINMNNNEYTGGTGHYSAAVVYNTHLTINDGIFYQGFQVAYTGTTLTLNNCNISITSTASGARYCVIAMYSSKAIINGGTFSFLSHIRNLTYFSANSNSVIDLYDCICGPVSKHNNVTVSPIIADGGVVNIYSGEYGFNTSDMKAINNGKINVYGGTFTASSEPTKFIAEGYKAYQDPKDPNKWHVR